MKCIIKIKTYTDTGQYSESRELIKFGLVMEGICFGFAKFSKVHTCT